MTPSSTLAAYCARHFRFELSDKVATVTLDRPEKKNPLTFDSYAELRDLFRAMANAVDVKAVVITGAQGNFCSGGDVHEIIAPLTRADMPSLLAFTRMTGELVQAMRNCPQPVLAAVDGVCAGAGAAIALAGDMRLGTARSKTAFLFSRVGLSGCDMGVSALLPRVIGLGRASELLLTGRSVDGNDAYAWGFFNRLCEPDSLLKETLTLAAELAHGPTFAHAMTKKMLQQQANMSLEQALEADAQAQALCMATGDFRRAYEAFAARQKPVFEGN